VRKRIHIIGRKNCGKTRLIVDLVSLLTGQGVTVGTIKHTHHHHEFDTPGKDSFQHRQAGASVVGILGPTLTAVFKPTPEPPPNAERYNEMLSLFEQCDLVLVEGDTRADHPKVEVWRKEAAEGPMAATDPSIVAVVTDDAVDVAVPVWSRSDVATLAENVRRFA
jgi:molybdopterin-guanine dinucleotide biosynthesis protein B